MTIDTIRLRSLSGDGVLLRDRGVVAYGVARNGDRAAVSQLLVDFASSDGLMESPPSSSPFAAQPPESVLAACFVVAVGERWRLAVYGDLDVEVSQPGSSMVVSGKRSSAWVVRDLLEPVEEVHVRSDTDPAPTSDLLFGVLAAGGFSLGPDDTELKGRLSVRSETDARPESSSVATDKDTGEVPASAPSEGHPLGSEPSISLDELPVVTEPKEPPPNAQAPVGFAVFDDSSSFYLDADYIIGREPEEDPAVQAGDARALVLEDPLVSRVHAELRVRDGKLSVVDKGSSNGTYLWSDEQAVWIRLAPDEPVQLAPRARVGFGQRHFTFEASSS